MVGIGNSVASDVIMRTGAASAVGARDVKIRTTSQ